MELHTPPEVTPQEAFLENLDRQVNETHESGGFTAVLELAEQHQATLKREIAEKALLNQQVEDLRWKFSQWTYVAEHSREFAANEAHGWTIMPDGTPAKALDNGQVLSSYGGVRYEEDDGTIVDTSKRDEQWERRHQRHVHKFGQRVRDQRLRKVRSRTRLSPQRRARHEHRPGRARRAASSSTSSSADPGSDGESPWPAGFTTFRDYDELVSRALPGHLRLRLFDALPDRWKREAWDALAEDLNRSAAR